MDHLKNLLSARLNNQFEDQVIKWTGIIDAIPHLPVEILGEVVMKAGLNIRQLKSSYTRDDESSDFLKQLEQQKNNLVDIYILARNSAQSRMDQGLDKLTDGWDEQLPSGIQVK